MSCFPPRVVLFAAIEGVEIAKGKGKGRMMSWSWLDGKCHSKVAGMLLGESIDVTSTLPAVVVVSRSKARRVISNGNPTDSSEVVQFVTSVLKGKRKTIGMNQNEKAQLEQAKTLFQSDTCEGKRG